MNIRSMFLRTLLYTFISCNFTLCAKQPASPLTLTPPAKASLSPGVHHYEYVIPDGWIYVYDADSGYKLIDSVAVPTTAGTRGLSVSPSDAKLYLSYRGDGGFRGNGSLLQFDLLADSVRYTKSYSHGVDSHDMSADGTIIYMPDGELAPDGKWYIVNAHTGNETGVTINTGVLGPHNTIVSRDGTRLFMGNRDPNNTGDPNSGNKVYFYVANTANDSVIQRVGPVLRGVRPFTVNGRGTIAFMTITGLLGFQVGNVTTGQVLYTVDLTGAGFPISPCITDGFSGGNCQTSHGISLSPDETELYLIDSPNSIVHVFDVSGVEHGLGPKRIFDIPLNHHLLGQASSCAYDCLQIGWLQHSIDGKLVYVGDCGDIISTQSHTIVGYIPTLRNTRKMVEIDWKNGTPIAATTRLGIGNLLALTTPPAPALVVPVDFALNQPQSMTFRWHPSGPPVRYQIELATDSLFASLVLTDTSLVDTARTVASLQLARQYFWRVRAYNAGGKSSWSALRRFTTAGASGNQFSFSAGWNLLSLPAVPSDPRTTAMFPLASSGAFYYNGAYQGVDSLVTGTGYWLRLSGVQMVIFTNPLITRDTIPVNAGWNLIGAPGVVVSFSSITSNPPGLATSNFFGFNGSSYIIADSLRPAKGYWVKTDNPGVLYLTAAGVIPRAGTIRIVPTSEMPPPPPGSDHAGTTLPDNFRLDQNYPNPFNPVTTIVYALPVDAVVTLKIYNTLGEVMKTLADHLPQSAGDHRVTIDAGTFSSGVYYYRLLASSATDPGRLFSQIRKMIFLK
jgi:hypothetical protein